MSFQISVAIYGNVYVTMNGAVGPTGTNEPGNGPRPCPSGPTGSTGSTGSTGCTGPSGPTGRSGPTGSNNVIDLTQSV